MSILQAVDLKKYYGQGDNVTKALDGVSLTIEEGEFVAIVGTSGSGKSTLLHMMGGLDTPTSGRVLIGGKELFYQNEEKLAVFRRRHIGFVFQSYNLVPVLNVYENMVLPLQLDGRKADKKLMKQIVHALGLQDKLQNLANHLSGGQQQRVSIARALLTKPEIILADEPTGNLDSRTSADVLSLLKDSSRRFHQTIVMITHDREIAELADRSIRIEDGKITDGSLREPPVYLTQSGEVE
ncbi:MAG: ABC transporter ATP-binding protein [Lachnospiraceae bacterium]